MIYSLVEKKTIIKNTFRTIIIHFQKNNFFTRESAVLILGKPEILFLIATIRAPL